MSLLRRPLKGSTKATGMTSIETSSSWTARRDSPRRRASLSAGWGGPCLPRPRLCCRSLPPPTTIRDPTMDPSQPFGSQGVVMAPESGNAVGEKGTPQVGQSGPLTLVGVCMCLAPTLLKDIHAVACLPVVCLDPAHTRPPWS